jgi:hypothetical protein
MHCGSGSWADEKLPLVLERHDGPAVAAKCGYLLDITIGLRQGHYGSIAVNGVAAGGKVPASTFGVLLHLAGRTPVWLRWFRNRHAEQQG